MPTYLFRTLPTDNEEGDIEVDFADDEAALADARRALGDLLQDEAQAGKAYPKTYKYGAPTAR